MKPVTKRVAWVCAGAAGFVGIIVAVVALLIRNTWQDGSSADRPFPAPMELSLGEQFVFHPEPLAGGDEYHWAIGRNGEFWVFCQKLFQPLMAARIEKGVQPSFEPISPKEWVDADRVSVSNDASGNPVVLMMGCVQDARDTHVVARKWSGQGWTEPVELDAFDGSGTFGYMISFLDSKGRVHVVYDRRLEPYESYGFMHGQFPDKCFHAWSDGQKWNRAKATTGRGEFYLDPRFLSELPDGKVCLALRVSPFSSWWGLGPDFQGCQFWDGSQWSDIVKERPREARCQSDGEPVLDYWGNTVSWSGEDGKHYCLLKKRGSDSVESIDILSAPLLKRDLSGRIIVCSSNSSEGEIRVWKRDRWTGPLRYPLDGGEKASRILCNPDGSILVVHEGESRIVVQRIQTTRTEESDFRGDDG
jgi:hypothetical protein